MILPSKMAPFDNDEVTRGKWEVGGMGNCVTNAASTTDWPHHQLIMMLCNDSGIVSPC